MSKTLNLRKVSERKFRQNPRLLTRKVSTAKRRSPNPWVTYRITMVDREGRESDLRWERGRILEK